LSKARREEGIPPSHLSYFTIEHRGSEPFFGNPRGITLQLGSPESPAVFPFGIWKHGTTFKMLKTRVELVSPEDRECMRFFDGLVAEAISENVRAHGQGSVSAGCYVGPDPKEGGAVNGQFYKLMCSEPPEGKTYAPSITCEFNCLQSGDLVRVTEKTPVQYNYDPGLESEEHIHLWPSFRTTWRVAKPVPGQSMPVWHKNFSKYPVEPCKMVHITTGRLMDMTSETLTDYINTTMSPGQPDKTKPPTPKKMYGSIIMSIGRSYHHKNTVGLRRYGNRILIMGVQQSRARSILPGLKETEWLASAAIHAQDFNADIEDPTVQAPVPSQPEGGEVSHMEFYQ